MIQRWRDARARRRDDKAVIVTALLAHLGPLTFTGLWRYVRGGSGDLYAVLIRLEGSGRIDSDWLDGPPPRRRIYRYYQPS